MALNFINRSLPLITLVIYLNVLTQISQTYNDDRDQHHHRHPHHPRHRSSKLLLGVHDYGAEDPEFLRHLMTERRLDFDDQNGDRHYGHNNDNNGGDSDHINNYSGGDDDDDPPAPVTKSKNRKPMMKIGDLNQLEVKKGIGHSTAASRPQIAARAAKPSAALLKGAPNDQLGQKLSEPQCGQSDELAQRIVGGTDAVEGSHPWIVAILKNGDPWCGGSILNNNWIVTASHCFMGDDPPEASTWAIRVGTINRNMGTTYKIKKVITHERFNLDGMLNSDIALMKVAKPIKYTNLIKPVCLPPNSFEEPKQLKLIVAGWGAQKFDSDTTPVMLQDVTLNLVRKGDCSRKYKSKSYKLYKSQICTWNYKQDACQGDSGGPIVEIDNGKGVLVGVVSYGSTCADDFPGVYTEVSHFLKWLEITMKNN